MNVTVSVALISAGAALFGSALTALSSAWLTSRQLRHQRGLAQDQRLHDRSSQQRQHRREAYEQFLAQVDAAYRLLDQAWQSAPFTDHPNWEAGFVARRVMDETYVRVQLEGPAEVAASAAAVVKSVGKEFRLVERTAVEHESGDLSPAELDSVGRSAAVKARFATTEDFILVARSTLNGELGG
ncbi:hypothetical protein D5S17_17510 [Pseudonocardiaceae bacterium YIM PH 21723]|nr:hypothetical protein D5S17_17510 [Pseudonocardiaceae bacterium YIM PH 21723]